MYYIFTRHWDYWYTVYRIGKYEKNSLDEVEFHISNQNNREAPEFFHFDFYSLTALKRIIEENDFIDHSDLEYEKFIEKYNALQSGEIDFFIGSLYYETFSPSLTDCNQALLENNNILEFKSPSYEPYYAVIFINERNPLTPDLLIEWTKKVSKALFGKELNFEIADMPNYIQTLASYEDDGRF